jgi:hypothetical protein
VQTGYSINDGGKALVSGKSCGFRPFRGFWHFYPGGRTVSFVPSAGQIGEGMDCWDSAREQQ